MSGHTNLHWQENLVPSGFPSLSQSCPPCLYWMHGGGQQTGCFKSTAMEGLRSSYYMKYGPESWKNFPVQEIDAYRARYGGPGTSPAIYCVFGTCSSPPAHFPI